MNGVGGGADCGRIRRAKSKKEGCCNAVGARGEWMENLDAPGVRGEPGGHRPSGREGNSPDAHFLFADISDAVIFLNHDTRVWCLRFMK